DLDKGDYAAAQKILAQVKPSIVDSGQQADWLWLNAEAQYGVAKDSKDPTVLKNVALDYMRLVANFPTSPKVAQALLKTAEIHEKLDDTKTAVAIYQQVAKDYEHDPE